MDNRPSEDLPNKGLNLEREKTCDQYGEFRRDEDVGRWKDQYTGEPRSGNWSERIQQDYNPKGSIKVDSDSQGRQASEETHPDLQFALALQQAERDWVQRRLHNLQQPDSSDSSKLDTGPQGSIKVDSDSLGKPASKETGPDEQFSLDIKQATYVWEQATYVWERRLHDLEQEGTSDSSKLVTGPQESITIDFDSLESTVDFDSLERPASEVKEEVIANIKEPQSDEISQTTNSEADKDRFALFLAFPPGYEFTMDMLIWQWVAEGLMKFKHDKEEIHDEEEMESICLQCFKKLLEKKLIVPSGYDYWLDQKRYKVGGKMNDFLQKTVEGKGGRFSLSSKEIDCINFGDLKKQSSLRTLILHQCYNSKFKCLPDDLFLELKVIRNLNLSYTDIVELPTSIENLTELRYLDVSHTPIMWLPESISFLVHLLMFNLDGCDSLNALPRSTNKLVNLCHLILNATRDLELIPFGIGKLVKLRNLQTFLVGTEDGHRIVELKDLNELRGSLRIFNLENVKNKEEANAACLQAKGNLKKIKLQWSDLQDEMNTNEEQILKSLQPPPGIQELKICFYSGGVLPAWISDGSLNQLVSITFVGCRYCSSLPSLGALPSLKHLSIVKNNEVVKIDSSFCRQVGQDRVAFPKLEELSFDSMSKLEAWTEVEKGDFPLLQHITIKYCPEFVGLPLLSDLKSLKDMEIRSCPKLASLPEGGLPANLECLMINDCPKLNDKYGKKDCKESSEVAKKVALYFDYHQYSA